MATSLPVVSLVGRPNVGKSTLFNRVIKRRAAVVDDMPGVTRDRHVATTEWEGSAFLLMDTGGLLVDSDGALESRIREQVQLAIEESDLVLVMVDGRAGLVPDDIDVVNHIRRSGVAMRLVVTKIDSQSLIPAAQEFTELGIHPIHFVSGLEGHGLGELFDDVAASIPKCEPRKATDRTRIAVIGKPNVGKSSLVNALLQRERMVVSELPGTTRDAIDTDFRYEGRDYTLVDTAGLGRRAKTGVGVEFFSALRTERSLARADVAIVVLDMELDVARQDYRVASLPYARSVPVVFVFNKWDLVDDKETLTTRDIVRDAARHVPDFKNAPSIFVSAKTTQRVSKIMPLVDRVFANSCREVPDDELLDLIERATVRRSHPWVRGKMLRFWSMRQAGIRPPRFIVYCNRPASVETNYRRFLVNQLRERFDFEGTPIRLMFRRQ